MKTLKISKEISLPLDAVTQTFGFIGRKGAGKTYLATMVAEQMLDANAQVVVIDPVGVWYGLRIGADGKSKGKDIFVIGGEHGDVPLVPEAGARIARLVVEKGVSAVLDVSSFRIGEFKRFSAEFAEEFFHLKKASRSPVHIFIEEAQKIIPQRVGPDEARMVGAFEQIVRLGRNYGIGCSLVTQRPQSVNKEVLSQVECLCVLQVTGPHERKALEDWVQEVGADRTLIGELPGLARGEGYVWSPGWLRVFKRVHFSKKETFDSSATPEVGKVTKAAKLSKVDVEALVADMKDVVDKATENDPKLLKKKITDLEKMNASLLKNPYQKDLTKEDIQPYVEKAERQGKELYASALAQMAPMQKALDEISKLSATALNRTPPIYMVNSGKKIELKDIKQPGQVIKLPVGKIKEWVVSVGDASILSKGELLILKAIAQYPEGITNDHIAVLTGYKATSRRTYLQRLSAKGFIATLSSGYIGATETGIDALGSDFEPLPEGKELQVHVMNTLPDGEKRVLSVLLGAYPNTVSRDELMESTNYKATSIRTYLQRLSARRLIETGGGNYLASDKLF